MCCMKDPFAVLTTTAPVALPLLQATWSANTGECYSYIVSLSKSSPFDIQARLAQGQCRHPPIIWTILVSSPLA